MPNTQKFAVGENATNCIYTADGNGMPRLFAEVRSVEEASSAAKILNAHATLTARVAELEAAAPVPTSKEGWMPVPPRPTYNILDALYGTSWIEKPPAEQIGMVMAYRKMLEVSGYQVPAFEPDLTAKVDSLTLALVDAGKVQDGLVAPLLDMVTMMNSGDEPGKGGKWHSQASAALLAAGVKLP